MIYKTNSLKAFWKLPNGKIVEEIEFGKYIDPKTGKKKLITKSMKFIKKTTSKKSKKSRKSINKKKARIHLKF